MNSSLTSSPPTDNSSSPASTAKSQKPLLVIKPTSGWQAVDFREIWQFRDLLWNLALRDVKLRYKQTALGVVWVVLQPIISAGVYTFLFSTVAKIQTGHIPYFIYSYSGLVGWNLFSATVGKSSGSLVGNAHLVSKVYFPRLILPFYTVLGTLQDVGVSMVVFFIAMLMFHFVPGLPILMAPVFALFLLIAGMGVGLISAALTVHFRDVSTLLNFLINFLMYACPVIYPPDKVPAKYQMLYNLNPLSALIEGMRWSLLKQGVVRVSNIVYSAIASIVIFMIGVMLFRRMEKQFADVI